MSLPECFNDLPIEELFMDPMQDVLVEDNNLHLDNLTNGFPEYPERLGFDMIQFQSNPNFRSIASVKEIERYLRFCVVSFSHGMLSGHVCQ